LFTIRVPCTDSIDSFANRLNRLGIETVCVSARCPNRPRCFSLNRVSVLILGGVCTRACRFCSVPKARLGRDYEWEINAIERLVEELSLRFLVITSVTRDDLPDGGAGHFCSLVNSLKQKFPSLKIELLIPDFGGEVFLIKQVAQLKVEVIGHNIETIPKLYPIIRPQADYYRSLQVLKELASLSSGVVKSSVMVGLGEEEIELIEVFNDLKKVGVKALCIGQYLPPERSSYPVQKYYGEEDFDRLKDIARDIGFEFVWSGPLVRSSFVGEELYGL